MSNCKHLKIKLDRTIECRLTGKTINWNQCKNCKLREFKINNSINVQYNVKKCKKNAKIHNISQKAVQIKQKSSKLSKLERNRFSIITDDLEHCIICGTKKDNLHEVFFGTSRINSMKYGLVIPLCIKHHREMHKNKLWQDEYHKKGQLAFMTNYPDLNFVDIFKRNYL